MKKALIDLNVILEFLIKRNGHEEAALIFERCVLKKISGVLCAHEITTLSYFLLKHFRNQHKVKSALNELLNVLQILPTSEKILKRALDSSVTDYEDAVIEVSALEFKIDVIITRNIKDFQKSRIKAITPTKYLNAFI